MANDFTVRVRVQGGADVDAVKKALEGLGATVQRTRGSVNSADKSQQDFFDTQKKGIIGTANSTKSFSKLAETLGTNGSSGLVGAYATLAANIFAVTAAFNALRNASQVEQIFRGLEASGARTGLSLNSTAKALREVTGAAISTEQAMRSTAQITSAGFSGETVERLGKAARDASFALGRNMTDSLDRLSRGVVKLEPELLDELGIMTKLTESNVRYAQQLGKTESQLSNFEKRQGFLNAVIAEAELKFGGLSAAAGDSTAYDRLAATFSDLTTTIMNVANVIAKPLAGALASSSTLILGLLISFGSTLKNQLLPGLAGSAAAANKNAQALKELSVKKLEAVQLTRALAQAEQEQALITKTNFSSLNNGPRVYANLVDSIKAGTASLDDQQKALTSLQRSYDANERILRDHTSFQPNSDGSENAKRTAKLESQKAILDQMNSITELSEARKKAAAFDIETESRVAAAKRAARVAGKEAAAQEAAAASIAASSQLKLDEGWKQLRLSVRNYAIAQALASDAGYAGMAKVRTAIFAATTATKALGAAFLTALPWIGLIVTAVGLLKSAWEGIKSDAVKELEKSIESFNEKAEKAVQYGNEIARINKSQSGASTRAAAAFTIQSNSIREITEAYQDYLDKKAKVDQDGGFSNIIQALTSDSKTENTVASFWASFFDKGADLSNRLGIRQNSQVLGLAKSATGLTMVGEAGEKALKTLNTLNEAEPTKLDAWVRKHYGSWEALNKQVSKNPEYLEAIASKVSNELGKAFGEGAEKIKALQESLKQLEADFATFYRSSAISTPFDAVVKSITSANNSIVELSNTYDNSSGWKTLLTGLDANTTSGLSVGLQKDLQAFQKADTVVQSLLDKQESLSKEIDERTGKTKTLSGVEQRSLERNQTLLTVYKDLGSRVAEELLVQEEKFLVAQKVTRESAATLALLQAQIGANGALYKAGAAGLRAKLADEAKVREIQKSQLEVQRKILESTLTLNEEKIKSLNTSIRENETLLERVNLINQINRTAQESSLAEKGIGLDVLTKTRELGAGAPTALRLAGKPADPELEKQINSYLAYVTVVDRTTESLGNQKKELRSLVQSNRELLSSVSALKTQMAAIDAPALSGAEKAAAYQRAELEFRSGSLTALRAQEKTLVDINAIYRESDSIINGTSNTLTGQIKLLAKSAEDQKQALRNDYTDKLRELDTALREARAQRSRAGLTGAQLKAADALVNSAQESLTIAQRGLEIELQKVDAQQQLNVLQKTFFDTQSQGLQWQQDALELTRKRLEVQKNFRDEVLKENELRVRLEAKRRGFDVTQSGEQALEIRAASEAYRFAVEESKLKKSMIDLEFALIDAQRQQLKEELSVRRDAAAANGDTDRVRQLDATLQNLDVDLGAVVKTAKRAVDRNVENLRLTLETAMTRGRRGESESLGANILGALRGYQQRQAAVEQAKDNLATTPIEVKSAEIVARKTGEAINPLISSNTVLIQSIRDWIAVIDKQIGTYRKGSENLTGLNDAKSIGNYLKSLGFNVTENQNFGGVTRGAHKGRGHYEGRAFDVSLGAGNADVNNPQFKARTIAMARELAKQGLTTLFDGIKYAAGGESKYPKSWGAHKDHAHVEIPRGWKPSDIATVQQAAAERVSQTLQTGADRAAETLSSVKPAMQLTAPTSDNSDIVVNGQQAPKPAPYATPKWIETVRDGIATLDDFTNKTLESLSKLGPQGEVVVALYQGVTGVTSSILDCVDTIGEFGFKSVEGLTSIASVASSALSTVQSVVSSVAAAKEEAIQREIDAEQKRDGKSAESVAKIAALEKRKDEIARKTFNTNKKLMMAQAVISTATGVATALSIPFIGIPLAAAIGALGAAQIAIIAGTSYQSAASSSANAAISTPTLTIGKRGDSVDLAKQNSNVGGELGYLRGRQGTGTNSSNYSVIGSAYGADDLFRGYGNTAFAVGEKGPEIMTKDTPITVRPINESAQGGMIDAKINITALDASGVEDVLLKQKGNIIAMLREAANTNGKPFMEEVNVNVYSSPNKTGGTKL